MKIVLATFGSLGDIHPMIALGIELQRRRHTIVFAAMELYRERIDALQFEFCPLRPNVNPEDKELARALMDAKSGTERLILDVLMPNLMPMYEDLSEAVKGADVLISGEVVYAAASVVEKTGVKWITTSLAPASFLSAYDPFVPPVAQWMENIRFFGVNFHRALYFMLRRSIRHWYEPYQAFRRKLGLSENHDPIFDDKYSKLLHLAMFSKILGKPQPDWHSPTLQTGFCFYDGQNDSGKMPEKLNEFLDEGEPPIVFTLGSAAVMDARDFFEESAKAAKILGCRAVLLYGIFNEPPKIADSGERKVETGERKEPDIIAFDYAPYSQIFPRAACVVHQGGVGTTAQVLRAGVPHLIMPYAHDQPDNAARCARIGVARTISREKYTAENAAKQLSELLGNLSHKANAEEAKRVVIVENGVRIACDAITDVLK
ncbi:MAG: glycosyltransferase family 1 protein [Acidobacteria bacterium]|nr:glycosyltransferase family 1 protein [Acidobacteriota bacterium]